MIRTLIATLLLLTAGCSTPPGDKTSGAGAWTPPAAGTVVAADSMKVAEDQLNNSYFSVKLVVSEGNTGKPTDGFKYDVLTTFGAAQDTGLIIMPFGGERLKPLLRRGEDYSYVMGFIPGAEYGNDTAFHEYYEIAAYNSYIKIRPLKGFRMEQ